MALISLEIATDGLIRTGGRKSLAIGVRGLLRVAVVVVVVSIYPRWRRRRRR